MTAEEVFCDLYDKYGDEFNWSMIPFTDKAFVDELKREIRKDHFLYGKRIWAVAKCDSRDDVLYLEDTGIYYIFHLTYSECNTDGFPRYKRFVDLYAVKEYIEREFVAEYL